MQRKNNVKILGKFKLCCCYDTQHVSFFLSTAQINEHNSYVWNGILPHSLQNTIFKIVCKTVCIMHKRFKQ